jgi:xylose isomerase
MIEDGALAAHVAKRYAAWDGAEGKAILSGERSLADLAARVEAKNAEPQPRSGRQEYLENLVNSYV